MHKTRNLFRARWLKRGSGFLFLYDFCTSGYCVFAAAHFRKLRRFNIAEKLLRAEPAQQNVRFVHSTFRLKEREVVPVGNA